MTKQEIFDTYAKNQGYKDWEDLRKRKNGLPETFLKHIFNATDLVCMQTLENAMIDIDFDVFGQCGCKVYDIEDITNCKHIPK